MKQRTALRGGGGMTWRDEFRIVIGGLIECKRCGRRIKKTGIEETPKQSASFRLTLSKVPS